MTEQMQEIELQVERLENQAIPLEEAMEAFENGVKLVRAMQDRLSELEQKIQLISASSGEQEELPKEES